MRPIGGKYLEMNKTKSLAVPQLFFRGVHYMNKATRNNLSISDFFTDRLSFYF